MKKILCGAVAALAVAVASAPASAQTSEEHFAGTRTLFTGNSYEFTNPTGFARGVAILRTILDFGTRYRASADAPPDSELATPEIDVVFSLSGTVNRDCSFYSGNNNNARNIDFGVIGVRTGDNENVANAFTMVGDAEANIDTLTAGCNFNNTVEIVKDSARGLVNTSGSGFDSDQFQDNIPYQVTATWVGTTSRAGGAAGTTQTLTVADNAASNTLDQGAWRSRMDIDIVAPAVTGLGLVAGDYTGTTTLTLSAL